MVITIRSTGHIASGGKGCEGGGALREKNSRNQELEDRKKKEGGGKRLFPWHATDEGLEGRQFDFLLSSKRTLGRTERGSPRGLPPKHRHLRVLAACVLSFP